MTLPWILLRSEPPLDPGGDEARRQLRRELAKPDYYDRDLLGRLAAWARGLLDDTVAAASGAPPVGVAAAVVVALGLLTALLVVVSRARRTARAERNSAAVLIDEAVTAAELRARAERALLSGDAATAVVEAFRALTLRQTEDGHLEDLPGATAGEVSRALAEAFPEQASAVRRGADTFDEVLYGDHPAHPDQARALLALDDALRQAARRVRAGGRA